VSIVDWELNDKPRNVVIHVVKELNVYVYSDYVVQKQITNQFADRLLCRSNKMLFEGLRVVVHLVPVTHVRAIQIVYL
jgi:hypothetical protein